MIFLGELIKINENIHKVHYINYYAEEYTGDKSKGVIVDKLPTFESNDKRPILYVNTATKETFYEYEEIPKSEEDISKEKIDFLEKQVADLTFMIMQLQGGTN